VRAVLRERQIPRTSALRATLRGEKCVASSGQRRGRKLCGTSRGRGARVLLEQPLISQQPATRARASLSATKVHSPRQALLRNEAHDKPCEASPEVCGTRRNERLAASSLDRHAGVRIACAAAAYSLLSVLGLVAQFLR
jgi:hypothetical protein